MLPTRFHYCVDRVFILVFGAFVPPINREFVRTDLKFKQDNKVSITNIKMAPIHVLAIITPKPDRVARVSAILNPLLTRMSRIMNQHKSNAG